MTNKEISALGEIFLRKAWDRGKKDAWHVTDAQVYAVGDLVRLVLDMKDALMDIEVQARLAKPGKELAEWIQHRAKAGLLDKEKKRR